MGLCTVGLAACSVLNHFDDVKPAALAGAGGSSGAGSDATTSGTSGSGGLGSAGSLASGGSSGSGTAGSNGGGASATGGASAAGGASGAGGIAGSMGIGGAITADSGPDGTDGATAGEAAAPDAPPDTSVPLVVCRFVIGTPTGGHVKLDDYSTVSAPQRTVSDKFFLLPLTNTSSVRILTQLGGNANTYNQYIGSDGGAASGSQSIVSQGRLVDAQKLNVRQTGALVIQNGDPATSPTPRLVLHTFDDSNFSNAPTMTAMTNMGQLGTGGSLDALFAPGTDGRIAVAASFEVAAGRSRAAYGLYSGAPIDLTPLLDDASPDNIRPQALTRVPGTAGYAFLGGEQSAQWVFEVKDSDMTPAQHQMTGSSFVLLADPNSTGLFNFAAADFGTLQAPVLKLSVGQVDPAKNSLLTVDPASFAVAKSATSMRDVPVGSLTGFIGDFLYFGGPTGVNGTELSILFVDVLGRIRAEQKLQDTQGVVSAAGIVPRGSPAGAGGKYHIAWTETHSDTMGKYDILYYDQIDCL